MSLVNNFNHQDLSDKLNVSVIGSKERFICVSDPTKKKISQDNSLGLAEKLHKRHICVKALE